MKRTKRDSEEVPIDPEISKGDMVKAKLRIGLAVGFAILFAVLVFKMSFQDSKLSYDEYGFGGHGLQSRKLNQPFSWHNPEEENANGATNKTFTTCRNSVQGKMLIADDKGHVCHRNDILSSGCCNANATSAVRYACSECHEPSGCCNLFEHCISCCMDPQKKPVLMNVLNEARSLKNLLLLSVSDHFELCLAKCRTSSRSVQHENIYINPGKKYCYTKEKPSPEDSSRP